MLNNLFTHFLTFFDSASDIQPVPLSNEKRCREMHDISVVHRRLVERQRRQGHHGAVRKRHPDSRHVRIVPRNKLCGLFNESLGSCRGIDV